MHGYITKPKENFMDSPTQARQALVLTLRDFLAVFPPALSRLPSSPEVLKAQRAVTVLFNSLGELSEKV